MVGEACLPSNAKMPWTPDYNLSCRVHVCSSEHSDLLFVYRSEVDLWLRYVDHIFFFFFFFCKGDQITRNDEKAAVSFRFYQVPVIALKKSL